MKRLYVILLIGIFMAINTNFGVAEEEENIRGFRGFGVAEEGEDIRGYSYERNGIEYCYLFDMVSLEVILEREGRFIEYSKEGIYLYESTTGFYGYTNLNGDELPAIYSMAWSFVDGSALVKFKDKDYPFLINTKGECIIELRHEGFQGYSSPFDGDEPIYLTEIRGKEGKYFVNRQGEIVSEERFVDGIGGKPYNLACKESGEWVYVDNNAKTVFSDGWECINFWFPTRDQEHYRAYVKKDGLWGIIDENGDYVLEPTYEEMSIDCVVRDGEYCMIDEDGNITEERAPWDIF